MKKAHARSAEQEELQLSERNWFRNPMIGAQASIASALQLAEGMRFKLPRKKLIDAVHLFESF